MWECSDIPKALFAPAGAQRSPRGGRVMQIQERSPRRRRDRWVQFRATANEAEAIAAQARGVGMSVGAYLRAVGAGYQPRAVVDRDRIDAIPHIQRDLSLHCGLL